MCRLLAHRDGDSGLASARSCDSYERDTRQVRLSRSRASSAFLVTVEGIFSRPLYATSAHTSLSCRHTIGSASRRASRRCAAAARRCSTRRERSCQPAEASETFAPNVSARTSGASSGRRRRAKRFFFSQKKRFAPRPAALRDRRHACCRKVLEPAAVAHDQRHSSLFGDGRA